ncbi:Negative elongation factor E [Taenia crassiceps]|uniref:Negative elongation factor E n=1 Tax=Taenia crassiceps TaxID=6207 RepID=A0ABR4QFY9_9CEST
MSALTQGPTEEVGDPIRRHNMVHMDPRIHHRAATSQASKTTEQAKEEAMKLLKSGAISFDTGSERHVFKRKLKESDGADSEDTPESGKGRKCTLYDNFVAGERINPTTLPANKQKPLKLHDSPQDSRQDFDARVPLHRLSSPDFEAEGRRSTGGSTIYISFNDINEAIVREIMEPYGPILNIRIDEKKCYGFVTLKSPEIAEKALMLDRTRFNNHRLRVNYARRQHRAHDINFDDNFERSSLRPTSRGGGNINRPPSMASQSPPGRGDKVPPASSPSLSASNRNLVNYSDVDY